MKIQILSLRKLLPLVMVVAFMFSAVVGVFSQTNPTPQSLPYTQDFASYTGAITTYPAGWQGWTVTGSTSTAYPTSAPAANQTQAGGTNASTGGNVYDFNGKIGFLCTGSAMKSICLSINTVGKNSISVSYLAGTQRTQSTDRIGAFALQYRVGNTGTFTTINESEYVNVNTTANTSGTGAINTSTISVSLPSGCNNLAEVQLRWVYREVSGSGGRPSFSIDNMSVTGTDIPAPSIIATGTISSMSTTQGAASAEQSFTVSGSNLVDNILVTAPTGFEVSTSALSGYANSITLTQSSGSVSSTTVYVRISAATAAGSISGDISVASTNATTATIAIPSSAVSAPSGLSQSISFAPLSGVTYGDSPLTLNATATSGLQVTYSSSNTSVVSISGSTLTIVGAGTASVTASQVGNATYNPAAEVINTIVVSPKVLTINNAAATNKVFNNNNSATITGTLSGVVGSDDVAFNGTGTFASVDVADGIVVSSTCTLTGTSAVNYTLTQPTGLTANITPAAASITFNALPTYSTANSTITLGATVNSGATVTYTSSNTAVATIAGNVVTVLSAGSTTITASATSTTNYNAAADVTQTLTVTSALMAFDFTGLNNVPTANPTYVLPGMLAASSQPMTRGTGAAGSAGANSFRTVGFQNNGIATTNTDYFQWTVTANPGLGLNFTSIDARYAGTASFYNVSPGVSVQYAYSLDGTNYTLIGSPSLIYSATTVASHTQPQIDLTGVTALQNIQPGTTVSFRFYASGQSTTGGWGFISPAAGLHGLVMGGSTFSVPCAFYADVDGDGYGNPLVTQNATCGTTIAGYVELNNTDCNDNAAGVNPAATELACNTIDDNCNTTVDENYVAGCNDPLACNYSAAATCATACDYTPQTFYLDADADNYGTSATTQTGCTTPVGYVLAGGDCNDNNNAVNPGATEVLCNSVDDNCNSTTDEGSVSGCTDPNASNYNALANCSAACNYTNFTAGNVLAVKLGTGTAALSSAGTPVFVEELSTSALVQTISIPTTGVNRMVLNGSSTAEGQMTRTQDGSAVVFPGYDAAVGTASVNTTTSVAAPRVISTLGLNAGTFARQASSTTHFSAQNFRSATGNGTDFWGVGANGGVNYFGTGTAGNVSTSTTNNRVIAVQNGQLYYSTGSGTAGVYAVGTGTPVVSATTSTIVFATGAGSSPYAFQFSADGNTCYVADDRTSAAGGIQKWVKTSGTWSLSYTISVGASTGARGLAVDFYAGAQPRLYAVINNTAGTGVVYFNDNGTSSPTINTLATATTASNQAYRSIAFAPCTSSAWYADTDGDGYGTPSSTLSYCTQPYGYVTNSTDCDDAVSAINPGAIEICDGLDNDCSGIAENGLAFVNYYNDADGDSYGAGSATNACQSPGATYVTNNTDCNDAAYSLNVVQNWYSDGDMDGYDFSVINTCGPLGPAFTTTPGIYGLGDCNDADASANPGGTEVCGNSIDEDCSGADLACPSSGFTAAVNVLNIGQFGTGVQSSQTVNLSTGINTVQSPGLGLDKWFSFTATSNAMRFAIVGSSSVEDDNDLSLYETPSDPTIQLIPMISENDVHPGNLGLATDGGSETLIYDELVVGDTYYLCVRNNNNAAGNVTLTVSGLSASSTDIAAYTGGTNTFTSACQNFKVKFRPNSAGYTIHRWASSDISGTPSWSYAIPVTSTVASTICQLGKIAPANLSGSNQTVYVTVDVLYNLKDAYGTTTPVTARANAASSFQMASEADLNVRATDRCAAGFKSTTSSIATNRSVCGTTRYVWEMSMVYPQASLPLEVLGSVGASRILALNSVPALANGQRYDVRIAAKHIDAVSQTAYGTTQCVKTIGAAGMPTLDAEINVAQRSSNGVTAMIYPNPTQGQMVNFSIQGLEGELQLKVTDAMGREVYNSRYIIEGEMNTTLEFGQALSNGVYMVEMMQNGILQTMRMVVSK